MGFFIFIVVVGVIIFNVIKRIRADQDQWRIAAERMGLDYHLGDFGSLGRISGRKSGHRICISTFTKSSGNSSSTYMKYRVEYNPRIFVDFKIKRQSALQNAGQMLGLHDIEVGDPSFDSRALVRGKNPESVKEFLTPARQRAIKRVLLSHNDVTITNDFIEMTKAGKDTDSAIIINTVHSLLELCVELTDSSSGRVDESIGFDSEDLEPAPVFDSEALAAIEPAVPAFEPYRMPNPIIPDPPRVEIEMPEADAFEEVTEPEPILEPELDRVAVLELQAVAADLYGNDAGTMLHSASRFKDNFENRRVVGVGNLKRVGKFSYDPIFKDFQGVKAIVEICELQGTYSKIKVRAEVAYAPEYHDELKSKIDSSFSISGKLIAQDSLMDQLYIVGD